MKILFVDDDPDILEQGKRFLEKENLNVKTTTSAKRTLELIEENDYDGIVADYKMPKMDGLELLKKVRLEKGMDIPFIIFTGKGQERVAMKALNLGADKYMRKSKGVKPQFEKLTDAIVEAVENYRKIRERKRAKGRLEKVEERFEKLFRRANEMIVTTDKKGYIKRINRKVEEELGFSQEELEGEPLRNIVHEEDRDKAMEYWSKLMDGERLNYELRMMTKDEETIHVRGGGTPIKLEGEIVEIQYNAQNITKWKKGERRLEKVKDRYEELFHGANEIVITTDKEGYVKRVNRMVEEIFGYFENELKGNSILKIAHPEDKEKYIEFWEEIKKAEEPTYQLRGLTKDGDIVHLRAAGRPIIEDGEIVEIQYNAQDITKRMEAEKRQEFLHSLLRHNLKNKISVIGGYLDILGNSDLPEEQQKFVEKAMFSVKKSDELIEKVRTLRKLQEEGEVQDVDLSEPLEKVAQEYEEIAEDRGIEMECETEKVTVRGGPLLDEVFNNLIENAIQHSEGDLIRIHCDSQEDSVKVSVEDNGRGIPDDDKERIFEKGYKKGEEAGTGLGTFLVSEIAENYGGKVEVKDSELGGARFEIELEKAE